MYITHTDDAMEARIGVLTAAVALAAQLQTIATCLVDGITEDFPHPQRIEASLFVIEVKHLAQIALSEAGYLLVHIRPLGEACQTIDIGLSQSTIVLHAFLQTAQLTLQQRRVDKL